LGHALADLAAEELEEGDIDHDRSEPERCGDRARQPERREYHQRQRADDGGDPEPRPAKQPRLLAGPGEERLGVGRSTFRRATDGFESLAKVQQRGQLADRLLAAGDLSGVGRFEEPGPDRGHTVVEHGSRDPL
jgi:hypothetical protein